MFFPADATPAQKAAASISEDMRVSQPRSHSDSRNSIADARPSMTATSAVSSVFASPRMPSVPNVSILDPLLPKTPEKADKMQGNDYSSMPISSGKIGNHQVDRGTGIFHGPGSPRVLSEVAEHGVNTLGLVGAPAGGGDPECPFRRFPGRLARHQAADAPVQPSGRQIDPVVRTGHLVTELIGHVVLQQEFRLHTDYVGQRRERVVKPDFPEHHGQDVQQILVDPGGEGLRKLLSIPASRPALGLDVELELRLGAARPDGYPAVVEPERDEVTGFPVSLALVWPVTSVAAVVDPRHAHPGQLLRTAAAQSLHHIAYRLESAAAGDDQRPAEVTEAADLRVYPVKVIDQRLPGPRQVFVQPCQVQGGRHRVLVPDPGRVEVTVGLFRREREKLGIGQRPVPAFGLLEVLLDRMS